MLHPAHQDYRSSWTYSCNKHMGMTQQSHVQNSIKWIPPTHQVYFFIINTKIVSIVGTWKRGIQSRCNSSLLNLAILHNLKLATQKCTLTHYTIKTGSRFHAHNLLRLGTRFVNQNCRTNRLLVFINTRHSEYGLCRWSLLWVWVHHILH